MKLLSRNLTLPLRRYGSSVSEWYSNPDYAFFETFFSRRLMRYAFAGQFHYEQTLKKGHVGIYNLVR